MSRLIRALIQALRLTLRGEAPTPPHFCPLEIWIAAGLSLMDELDALAAAESLDLDGLRLKLDGRPTSLRRSLDMVRHNLASEYPRLVRLDDPFSMMVVQSSNLNDQYRVGQFLAAGIDFSPTLERALSALNSHLLNLPLIEGPATEN